MSLLEQPSLAVLIDCWNEPRAISTYHRLDLKSYRNCMQSIKLQCESNTWIKAIAVASYGNANNQISVEQPWWNTAENFFFNETQWDRLRNTWLSFDHVDRPGTHEYIRTIETRPDQVIFCAFDILHIMYYCNFIDPSIRNIYFFGSTWDKCVKIRSVGWAEVSSLNHHNLFQNTQNLLTNQDCIFLEKGPVHLTDPWQRVTDNTFILTETVL